jgi:hypothetical protein
MTADKDPLADQTLADEDVADVLELAARVAADAAVLAPELRRALGRLLLRAAAVRNSTGKVDPLVLDVAKAITLLDDVPWRREGKVVRNVIQGLRSDPLEIDERGRIVLHPPGYDDEQS